MTRDLPRPDEAPPQKAERAAGGPIGALLSRARSDIGRAAGLRGALLLAAAASGVTLASLVIDRLFRLGVPARGVLLVVYAGALAWAAWRFLARPLTRALGDLAIADVIERRYHALGDSLRSAVDFLRDPAVGGAMPDGAAAEVWLKRLVVRDAETRSREFGGLDLIDQRAMARSGLAGAAALLAVVAVFALSASGTAGLWFRRNVLLSAVEWPYRTYLDVEGFENGRRGVPSGDALLIDARARGEIPDRAWIDIEYAGDRRRQALSRIGDTLFRHEQPEVREPFRFRVRGGDYRSPWLDVDVLERPRLDELIVRRVYPDYIGAAPDIAAESAGELAVPVGTRLEIEARATKPLREASLTLGEETIAVEIEAADPRRFRGKVLPAQSALLGVRYVDREGVVPETLTQIHVRLVPDRAPAVKLRATGIGTMVSAEARIPLGIEATDDHRVDRLALAHVAGPRQVADANAAPPEDGGDAAGDAAAAAIEGSATLEDVAPDAIVKLSTAFEVGTLGVEPERRLSLRVIATDNDTLNGPNAGESTTLEFLIVTHEKLMDDFLRRQEDQRAVFERMIERERAIRDAIYRSIDTDLRSEGPLDEAAASALAAHGREERGLATQSAAVANAIEAILTEMKNNRVGEADDIERIGARVITPLRELADDDLPGLAARLDAVRRIEGAAQRMADGLRLAEDTDEVIRKMEVVLANMVKLESFSEIINILRSVLKLQGESREAAQKAYEKILDEDIFERR